MKNRLAAACIGMGLLALAGSANALTFNEVAGLPFEQLLIVTPTVDNKLTLQVSGAANQFEFLSFSFDGGPSVTAKPLIATPEILAATFSDFANSSVTYSAGVAHQVMVSGKARSLIDGGEVTVSVNVRNGTAQLVTMYAPAATIMASVPEPKSYAMLLAGLALLGAKVARRRVKS